MSFTLPKLPYDLNALEPFISAETMEYHHLKHHQIYVDNLNKLTVDTEYANQTLENIIKNSTGGIFNNAAQVWNHTFYFNGFSPKKTAPSTKLEDAIKKSFGSFDKFKEVFTSTAVTTFGSGWAWLVQNPDNSLTILSTSNAATPITGEQKPLLTCDVWEHAYYIDYRNARPKYLSNFWEIVNWEFVSNNLS